MSGTELVYNLFAECRAGSSTEHSALCVLDPGSSEHAWPVVRAILVAMLVKGLLTIVTFGIKVPAGIFIPTLGVGACAGRVMGIGMQWLQSRYPDSNVFRVCGGDLDCVIPGLYAMVGAAATLSGVTVCFVPWMNVLPSGLLTIPRVLSADDSVIGCHHV
jgi:chloride channel 3/4/5